jgi:hypothetical protein
MSIRPINANPSRIAAMASLMLLVSVNILALGSVATPMTPQMVMAPLVALA